MIPSDIEPDIKNIFDSFTKLKALVIGDLMLDCYSWGNVSRISPEAPVPIVSVTQTESRLGGAGNVALNIQALGATPIICSIIGEDDPAEVLLSIINKNGFSKDGILKSSFRKTTVKTRIIGNNHQLLRVDSECEDELNETDRKNIFNKIEQLIKTENLNVIILEDYNKGLLTPALIDDIIALAQKEKIPVTVDPKTKNFFQYKGVSLFKPNLKELKEGLKADFDSNDILSIQRAVLELKEKINAEKILVTLSERGMMMSGEKSCHLIPAHVRNIADVSGAGDTVISVASLCVALNLPDKVTVNLANLAGGLVCERVGVVPVNREKLLEEALNLKEF